MTRFTRSITDLLRGLVDRPSPLPDPARGRYGLTLEAERFLTPEVSIASKELRTLKPVDEEQFSAVAQLALPRMSELPFGPQNDYLRDHWSRFLELANVTTILANKLRTETPKILDVGMSVNTLILQELLPRATLVVLDRPDVVLPSNYPIRLYTMDLTDPSLDEMNIGERFDVILFAEVIEHLLADPVRVLRFFVRHLTPGGRLVVTTPNFFARHHILAMEARRNPQPVFKSFYTRENANAHHVREYAMSELLEMSESAGADVVGFFYSACWDKDPGVPEEELQNLCVVVGSKGTAG